MKEKVKIVVEEHGTDYLGRKWVSFDYHGFFIPKEVMALLLATIEGTDMANPNAYTKDFHGFFKNLMRESKDTLETMFYAHDENDYFR